MRCRLDIRVNGLRSMSMPTVLLANRMLWSKQQPRCTSRTFRGVHKAWQKIKVQYYTILTINTTPRECKREKLHFCFLGLPTVSISSIQDHYYSFGTRRCQAYVSLCVPYARNPCPPPPLPPTVHAAKRPVLHTGHRCTAAKKMEKCECSAWIILSCEEATV